MAIELALDPALPPLKLVKFVEDNQRGRGGPFGLSDALAILGAVPGEIHGACFAAHQAPGQTGLPHLPRPDEEHHLFPQVAADGIF